MKKHNVIKAILIIVLLSTVFSMFSTLNIVYKNKDFLFNESGAKGITRIHLNIKNDYDASYIDELVSFVTEYSNRKEDVKVDTSKNREIIIKMGYTEHIKIENLTDRLKQKYGNNIEVTQFENIWNENPSETRLKIFIILVIELIIIISIVVVFISFIKKSNI